LIQFVANPLNHYLVCVHDGTQLRGRGGRQLFSPSYISDT
jgi:hypothetical protein